MRLEALLFVIQYLDEIRKKEIIKRIFGLAPRIKFTSGRAYALSLLVPHSDGVENDIIKN